MQWVDCESYFGPDRRTKRSSRLLDRRRLDRAGPPPSLPTAMRRFRLMLIDRCNHRPDQLMQRARALAELAELRRETLVAGALNRFCSLAEQDPAATDDETLSALYRALDCAETALKPPPAYH